MVNYFIINENIVRVSKEKMRPRGEKSHIVRAPYYKFPKAQLNQDGELEIVEDTEKKQNKEANEAAHEAKKLQVRTFDIDSITTLDEAKDFLKKLTKFVNKELNNDNDS